MNDGPDGRDAPKIPDMRSQWDARARENARFYVASTNFESEEEFDASGRRDAILFFEGHEDLLGPSVTALDLGCGLGRMDRHVAPRVRRLIGVDVSLEMLRRARRRLVGLANVHLVPCDGRSLAPFVDASVDLVFSHVVFQHVPKRVVRGYAHEVRRVLRPGGVFLFQVPLRRPDSPPDPPDEETFPMRFWTLEEARELCRGAGLAVERERTARVKEEPDVVDYIQVRARRP